MICTTVAYSLHQVTGAGSRAFSGDRALARRKVLDADAVAIASRKGGRKEHEAKRSVPSPATLPVGETRGFGGKAPICSALSGGSDCWERGEGPIVSGVREAEWYSVLDPVCACFGCSGLNTSFGLEERDYVNASPCLCTGVIDGGYCDVKCYWNDGLGPFLIREVLSFNYVSAAFERLLSYWRISRCATVGVFQRKLLNGIGDFGQRLFHEFFECEQGRLLLKLVVEVGSGQFKTLACVDGVAHRNVRGAVFVSRPPLVTGGKK